MNAHCLKNGLFVLLLGSFFAYSCQSDGNRKKGKGDKGDSLSPMEDQTPADSIFVRFDLEGAPPNRGQLSVQDTVSGQIILRENARFTAIPFGRNGSLVMLAIPNESIYPIERGDSIVISYRDYYPHIRVLNNGRFNETELNFSTYLARKNRSIFEYFFKRVESLIQESPQNCYEGMLSEIDSCQKNGLINSAYADWLRQEAKFSYYRLCLTKEFRNDQLDFSAPIKDDEYFYSYHYRSFLYTYAITLLGRNYQVLELIHAAKQHFGERAGDYLIYTLANARLSEEGDYKRVEHAIGTLKGQFASDNYFEVLSKSYLRDYTLDPSVKDPLLGTNDEVLAMDDMVRGLDKEIVFVDFWASWCVPCRVEMPSSLALQRKYKDKDIAFAYISIDKNQNAWLSANKEEKLGKQNSFLIADAKHSEFLKRYAINSIPRYFILGKEGKVINENAPKPSDPKLVEILDDLLN